MIKKYWEIKIREYNIMEKTGIVSQFRKWYNPFPVKYFTKQIDRELKLLSEKINSTFGDNEKMKFESLLWQVKSLNLINAIRSNILGISNILGLGTKLKVLTENHKRRLKRKLKFKNTNLSTYIKNIKKLTGIEIKELVDIDLANEYLQYKIDKYNEMMHKQQKNDSVKKVYLMNVVVSIFTYLNQTANVELTVLEFIDFRNSAVEKSKKEKVDNG